MNKTEIILAVIDAKKAKKYLEIGVLRGDVFNNVNCYKLGIDPNPQIRRAKSILRITSDEFFEKNAPTEDFDVIFIDGDHSAEQVAKDISNCLNFYPNAIILVHDTNPTTIEECHKNFRGDGYRVCDWIRKNTQLSLFTTSLDGDFMTAIRGEGQHVEPSNINFKDFSLDRDAVLNFVSNEEFIRRCI